MSYGLHIERSDATTGQSSPIPLDEWLEYVRNDPEMELEGDFVGISPTGEKIVIPSKGLALWNGHPDYASKETVVCFDWRRGRISVGNPDDSVVAKMKSIAKALSARVHGDQGEYYD